MGNLHPSVPFLLKRPSIHITPRRPTFSISFPVALDSESSLNREKLRALGHLPPREHAGYDRPHQNPTTEYPNRTAFRTTDSSKDEGTEAAYSAFLKAYPEYRLTWVLDTLRATDYSRLAKRGETYADYMGASLFPESLLRKNYEFLSQNIMGNTHSVSNR
jgi:molybdenum cofactor sulfurtransferase